VEMALQETFWALRFGVLVDRFGIPWTVNCERAAWPCLPEARDLSLLSAQTQRWNAGLFSQGRSGSGRIEFPKGITFAHTLKAADGATINEEIYNTIHKTPAETAAASRFRW